MINGDLLSREEVVTPEGISCFSNDMGRFSREWATTLFSKLAGGAQGTAFRLQFCSRKVKPSEVVGMA
jgi:hypothetical protein